MADNTLKNNNLQRSKFQDTLQELEAGLAKYRSSFPKNFGDMFRSKLFLICMIFAGYCILSAVAFTSFGNLVKAFFVSLAMAFVAIMLRYQPTETNVEPLRKKLDELKPMSEYPDVKKYIDNVSAEIDRTVAEKQRYNSKMNVIIYAFVAVLAIDLVVTFVKDNTWIRDDLENVHAGDNSGEFSRAAEFFNLQPKVPFVTLKASDNSLSSNNLELYIVNINTGGDNKVGDCLVGFRFAAPAISGKAEGDKFLLTITDAQGNNSSVRYEFKYSPIVTVRIDAQEQPALNIANYIFNHADELRYKVERLTH